MGGGGTGESGGVVRDVMRAGRNKWVLVVGRRDAVRGNGAESLLCFSTTISNVLEEWGRRLTTLSEGLGWQDVGRRGTLARRTSEEKMMMKVANQLIADMHLN